MTHFPEFFDCIVPKWMNQVLEWFNEGLIDGYLLHDTLFWLEENGLAFCRESIESLV